jgi:hypothetical protein
MAVDDDVEKQFAEAVNMTASELTTWLGSEDSKSVGAKDGKDSESTGHESGRRIVEILEKHKADRDDEDEEQMNRTVSYVHRHLAQRPTKESLEDSKWRYSLMNWGHDPLK